MRLRLLFNAAVAWSHLSAQSQQDEHEEEKQRPQWWDWKQSEGFWVGHEGQSRAVVGHLWHGHVEVVRHEAQDGENDKASINTGGTVGYTDDDAVSVCWETKKKTCCTFVKIIIKSLLRCCWESVFAIHY